MVLKQEVSNNKECALVFVEGVPSGGMVGNHPEWM